MKIRLTWLVAGIVFSSCQQGKKQVKPSKEKTEKIEIKEISNDKAVEKNHARLLKGKYVLEGSECAGFEFINKKIVTWTNEIYCLYPDTLKIKWIDNKTFLTIQMKRNSEACPPSVNLYKIVSLEQNTLTLQSIWTGWNDYEDELLIFTKN